ncbi:Fc.00g026160.m01.CDS01 [Cosmosporella sp. VM-42]
MAPWWAGLTLPAMAQLHQGVPGVPQDYFCRIRFAWAAWSILEYALAVFYCALVMNSEYISDAIGPRTLAIAIIFVPLATLWGCFISQRQKRTFQHVWFARILYVFLATVSGTITLECAVRRGADRSFIWRVCALVLLPAWAGFLVASYLYWNVFIARRPFGDISFGGGEVPDLTQDTYEDGYEDEDGELERLYDSRHAQPQPSIDSTELSSRNPLGEDSDSYKFISCVGEPESSALDSVSSISALGGNTKVEAIDKGKTRLRHSQEPVQGSNAQMESPDNLLRPPARLQRLGRESKISEQTRVQPEGSGISRNYPCNTTSVPADSLLSTDETSLDAVEVRHHHGQFEASSSSALDDSTQERNGDLLQDPNLIISLLLNRTGQEAQLFLALLMSLEEPQQRDVFEALLFRSRREIQGIISIYFEQTLEVSRSLTKSTLNVLRLEVAKIQDEFGIYPVDSEEASYRPRHDGSDDGGNDMNGPQNMSSVRIRIKSPTRALRDISGRASGLPRLPWQASISYNIAFWGIIAAIISSILIQSIAIWAAIKTVRSGKLIDW